MRRMIPFNQSVRLVEVPLELGFRFERNVEYLMTHTGASTYGGFTSLQGKIHDTNDEPYDMDSIQWGGGTTKTFKWVTLGGAPFSRVMFTTKVTQESSSAYSEIYGEALKIFNTYGDNPLDYIEISYISEGQRLFIVERGGL